MFERMRLDQVRRLKLLLDRFEVISSRAQEVNSEAMAAVRRGLTDGQSTASVTAEIAVKSNEQLALCGESISLLLVDRSLPLIFRRGVSRAEAFADRCELVLAQIEDGRRAGREAFRSRFGTPESSHAQSR